MWLFHKGLYAKGALFSGVTLSSMPRILLIFPLAMGEPLQRNVQELEEFIWIA